MKYQINLHFTATISKVVDIENEESIIDEKEKFINEYKISEAAECLAYDSWEYAIEE